MCLPTVDREIVTPIITGIITLAAVWLGSFLNQRNSFKLLELQKKVDLRNRSYSNLMGLKLAWSQAIRTNIEAKVLCEYYEARSRINVHAPDLEEAKRQNDRGLSLLPRISDLTREVFQSLGEVRLAFRTTPEIEEAIDGVYRFQALGVQPINENIETIQQLETWKNSQIGKLNALLKDEYESKIENLLTVLQAQIREG